MRVIVFFRRIWCPVRTVVELLTQTDWKFIREAVALVQAKSLGTPINRYLNTRYSVTGSWAYSSESEVERGEFCVLLRNCGFNFLKASSPRSYVLCHVKFSDCFTRRSRQLAATTSSNKSTIKRISLPSSVFMLSRVKIRAENSVFEEGRCCL